MRKSKDEMIKVYAGRKRIGIASTFKEAKRLAEQYNAALGRNPIVWKKVKK